MDKLANINAYNLFNCIQEFADQNTNPILQILNGTEVITPYQHYPENSFSFANNNWRCFYHCHDYLDKNEQEHGHLHFFTLINGQWSHVVALSMNSLGQPVSWFNTNKWVTEGEWLSTNEFYNQLETLIFNSNLSLLERWLISLLLFYKGHIESVFKQRDQYLRSLSPRKAQDIFTDREIYHLSHINIELTNDLTQELNIEQTSHLNSQKI